MPGSPWTVGGGPRIVEGEAAGGRVESRARLEVASMTRWVSTSVLALLLALSAPDAADGQPRARQGLVSLEDARLFY